MATVHKPSRKVAAKSRTVAAVKTPTVKSPKPSLRTTHHVDSPGRARNQKLLVDEEQLSLLVKIGCTMEEIGEVLHVGADTIIKNHRAVVEAARKQRNVAIRRKQYQLAMEGNLTALIWLGKQWLGQTDQMQLGNNPDNPLNLSTSLVEIVFVESDGQGRPQMPTTMDAPAQLPASTADAEETEEDEK